MSGEPAQADPHAGHTAPEEPGQPDPHAGHAMPAQAQADPHAGHAMPAQPGQTDPHAGHDAGAGAPPPAPPVAPPPAEAFAGPTHAADTVFPPADMAEAREELRRTHGDMRVSRLGVDQLELAFREGQESLSWEDLHFWYGGDINRVWIKSEGEIALGEGVERAEVQLLWSRAITPFFDLQAGVRYDFEPDPERAHLVVGVQGLAPYWLEVDGALFLSHRGDVTARLEGEYDQRLTQRLVLQPRAEVELSMQDVPELGIGDGLSTVEAGLRVRYEIAPEFAPYVGIEYERSFGDTARFARAAGEDPGGWSLVGGVRIWF